MRKLINISLGVALAATFGAAVPASAAPAVVERDLGLCGMPGMNADGNVEFGGIGILTHTVTNDNRSIMKCQGVDILNETGRTQTRSGLPCNVALPGAKMMAAEESHFTVTKNGRAQLTCTVTF